MLRAESLALVTALAHPSAIFMGRCCSNVLIPRIETLWAAVENCSPLAHYIATQYIPKTVLPMGINNLPTEMVNLRLPIL